MSSTLTTLKLSIIDKVACIELDLPKSTVNILSSETVADLEGVIDSVIADENIIGAIISSAKSNFIAGLDLNTLLALQNTDSRASNATDHFSELNALYRRLETSGKPFVAIMNGSALGAGLELALACHYRILADDSQIEIGFPEVTFGLLPAAGGTQRLPRLIGIEKALTLLLDGKPVDSSQALALGIVDELASKNELFAKAKEWINNNPAPTKPWDVKGYKIPYDAGAMATHASTSFNANLIKIRKQTQDNYPAPIAILSAVYEGTLLPFDLALQIEAKYFAQLYLNPVSHNLMRLKLTYEKQTANSVDNSFGEKVNANTQTTLSFIQNLVSQLEKTSIEANDTLDKFNSRLFCSYIDEGMAMLAEGIAPALIENAAIQTSFVIGPLAVTDEVSLDLQQRVVEQAIADNLAPERLRLHAQPIISLMNEIGRLGRKTAAGFYDYSAEQPKRLSPVLAGHYPLATTQPDVKDVADRLLYIQALESTRCIGEGIITPTDADLGATLELGFPSWTGGPLSFIDTIGVEAFVARCQQLTQYGQRFAPSKWLIDRAEKQQNFYSNNS